MSDDNDNGRKWAALQMEGLQALLRANPDASLEEQAREIVKDSEVLAYLTALKEETQDE